MLILGAGTDGAAHRLPQAPTIRAGRGHRLRRQMREPRARGTWSRTHDPPATGLPIWNCAARGRRRKARNVGVGTREGCSARAGITRPHFAGRPPSAPPPRRPSRSSRRAPRSSRATWIPRVGDLGEACRLTYRREGLVAEHHVALLDAEGEQGFVHDDHAARGWRWPHVVRLRVSDRRPGERMPNFRIEHACRVLRSPPASRRRTPPAGCTRSRCARGARRRTPPSSRIRPSLAGEPARTAPPPITAGVAPARAPSAEIRCRCPWPTRRAGGWPRPGLQRALRDAGRNSEDHEHARDEDLVEHQRSRQEHADDRAPTSDAPSTIASKFSAGLALGSPAGSSMPRWRRAVEQAGQHRHAQQHAAGDGEARGSRRCPPARGLADTVQHEHQHRAP